MPPAFRSQLVLYVAAAAAILLLGALELRAGRQDETAGPPSRPRVTISQPERARPVVHVAGAVRHPGVYRVRAGARIEVAIRRAGGPTPRADVNAINLAAKVSDGQQIVVPARSAPVAAADAADAAGAQAPAPIVDLNTATAEQLDQLDGVGPATAQKILDWRRQHGGFRSVDDLNNVPGIGEKRLAALRPLVRV